MNAGVTRRKKGFPWIGFVVYIIALIASLIVTWNTTDYTTDPEFAELTELNPEVVSLGLLFLAVIGFISGVILVGLKYLVTKFPTQWIAKDTDVYKNDIWSALFYSSAIGIMLELLISLLDFQMNTVAASMAISVITLPLFLFIYFLGERKPAHIKKAITIVSTSLTGIGILLSLGAL